MSSKFKVGDKILRITDRCSGYFTKGKIYTVLDLDSDGDPRTECDTGEKLVDYAHEFALVRAATKDDRLIAKAKADLAKLEERAALKAKQAAERKAKAERAKVMKGLSPAGKRVVELLRSKPDAFGCQRDHAISLACAIICDDPEKLRKALA